MNAADSLEQHVSFLTSGPTYVLSLPAPFAQTPQLTSVVNLESDGRARSFYFIPSFRDEGIRTYTFLRSIQDREGRSVELYRREEPPTVWWLRWALQNGALYTFLSDMDGETWADVVVQGISVLDAAVAGAPFLLLDPPFSPAMAAWPGYQDQVSFSNNALTDWGISMRRPGFLEPGKVLRLPQKEVGDQVMLRGGTNLGLDVGVVAENDLEGATKAMDVILTSLRVA